MRKVIGIGETILDVIFEGNRPSAAVPGGSVFNGIVSLRRTGINVCFISETGNDRVGNIILQFMQDNGLPTEHVNVFPDGKSPVSLAFLNERNDAEYIFYKDYPKQRLDVLFPEIHEDDIVVIGSYYALNPGLNDTDKIYKDKIQFYCPNFICTAGAEQIALRTKNFRKDYPIEPLNAVSTIGAGDNFNAGLIYGMLKYDVRYRDLNGLNEEIWDKIIGYGKAFAAEVCKSFNNSVSKEFAEKLIEK